MKRSITLTASEATELHREGSAVVLRAIDPQPTLDLRPYVDAATNEQVWGYEVGSMPKSAGEIEYSDGSFRSISPPQVRTWRCPWGSPGAVLAVREPWKPTLYGATPVIVYAAGGEVLRENDLGAYDWAVRNGVGWQSAARMPLWASRMAARIEEVTVGRDEAKRWEWEITLRRCAVECPTRAPAARGAPEDASALSGCHEAAPARQNAEMETSS